MPDISPKPLRIAIVGAGQIGSAFAFQLARVGCHDISVVARPMDQQPG
jgi:ketopantoate reductase